MNGLSTVYAIEFGSVYPMTVVEAIYRHHEFFETEMDAWDEIHRRKEQLEDRR